MATRTRATVLRRLKQTKSAETLADRSDVELVERFRSGRDNTAFRAILDRRRALVSPADVVDALQATFPVLVRRGHKMSRGPS